MSLLMLTKKKDETRLVPFSVGFQSTNPIKQLKRKTFIQHNNLML